MAGEESLTRKSPPRVPPRYGFLPKGKLGSLFIAYIGLIKLAAKRLENHRQRFQTVKDRVIPPPEIRQPGF